MKKQGMQAKVWASALATSLSFGGTAYSEVIPGSNREVAGWFLGAYDNNRGQFSHCAMSAEYKSGITMIFSISGNYSWRVGWSHKQWHLTKGQSVPIAVYVDGVGPHNLKAQAVDATMAFAELPAKGAVFDLMRKGYNMKVFAEGNTYGFNLDGTYAALTEILNCASRYSGNAPVQQAAPPAPLVPRGSQKPQVGSVTAEQRLEATKVVANILAQGEMIGFRILSSKDVAELKSEYFSSSDVVWKADGIIGTLRVVPKAAGMTAKEIAASVVSDDLKACKGQSASGSTPDQKATGVVRMFTACKEGSESVDNRYTVVPLADGSFYLFATASLSKVGDRNQEAAKADTLLRDAVFEVMKR